MMEPNSNSQINNRQKMDVSSLSLDKEGLRKFCDILQERANSAAEIEVGLFKQNKQSDDEYEASLATLRASFELKIMVTGDDENEHWGTIDSVFNSINFPEQVKSLYVDSESTLRSVHNYFPNNSFLIFLDFSKPRVFDFSLLPNTSTPNESSIEVKGYDSTWVNGVFSELQAFVDKRASTLSRVHSHSVYDVLLWVLGFPLSFWVCSKLSPLIESSFGEGNAFVVSALYLYAFVATLFVFRILFHYLRWICPLVEYQNKNNKMLIHRSVLGFLTLGWVGQLIYDIMKWLSNQA